MNTGDGLRKPKPWLVKNGAWVLPSVSAVAQNTSSIFKFMRSKYCKNLKSLVMLVDASRHSLF